MLLILSTEYDISTHKVIDWLCHFKVPFIRINDTSIVELHNFRFNADEIFWKLKITDNFKNKPDFIQSEQIKSFWYRRGLFNVVNAVKSPDIVNNGRSQVVNKLYQYTQNDKTSIIDFLYLDLKKIKHLGYFHDNKTIKINNLSVALECGLKVPATIITTQKDDVLKFNNQFQRSITKGINDNGFFVKNVAELSTLTKILDKSVIEKLPTIFAPSLIQEYIEKLFELRIFYIDGKCYTSAIFSQSDEKTKIDFRNYNDERPNRVVPYKIPESIELHLIKFMERLGMKTGSIDMILSNKMEYVFLEVNPIGQFDWISKKCNYHLEKIIANYFNN